MSDRTEPIACAVAADPLTRTAHADTGGLGRRRQRPTLINDTPRKLAPSAPTERRVTVQIHPGPSLGLSCLGQRSASKAARMNQRAQELHLAFKP